MKDSAKKWHVVCKRMGGRLTRLTIDASDKALAVEGVSKAVATVFGITSEELNKHFSVDAHEALECSGGCK